MKMTIQELKNSIVSILLENGVDFTIDNTIADQELGIVALFKLKNIDVNIYVSLREDVWVISRILSDRKEIIYFRKLESFLEFIRNEADRSSERKAQCDISSVKNILEGEMIKSEIKSEIRTRRLEPKEATKPETAESDKSSSVCGKFANEESKKEYTPDQLLGKFEKKEEPTYLYPVGVVEKVLKDRNIKYTTEDYSSSLVIKVFGRKVSLKLTFKLRPDLTNDVFIEQIHTEDSEVYMASTIHVRDRMSLEYFLCSLDTLLTELLRINV